MLLSTLELIITLGCILEPDGLHLTAANIMLGKPSRQSSTHSGSTSYHASNANDGMIYNTAVTDYQLHPFWQGDLQEFYTVDNITIRRMASEFIRNAYIGVSSVDVDCPNDDVTWCGQWPAVTSKDTLTFNCSHAQPVRFVRVWRNVASKLGLCEAEVEGTPRRRNAAKYDKSLDTKLTKNVTSVNAVSANDCGIKCHMNQSCLAFSYNPSVQLPCVLATSPATTTATGWVTYSISTCSKTVTCD